MKAVYLERTGPPEVLQYGEQPTPTVKPGQVLVRVKAVALNPIDVYIRAGMVNMNLPMPYVPGCDLAGVVEQLGEGTTRFRLGDRVWASNQGLLGRQGTLAEFAAVDESWLHPIPDGVAEETAAACALVGITAHLGLFSRMPLQAGERVFVNGGSGGVGAMVIQMAKAVGAHVTTSVGSAAKAELASSFGADEVLIYRDVDYSDRLKILTKNRGFDLWYETQPPSELDATVDLMAPRGRIIFMAGRGARPAFPNGPFYVKGLVAIGFAMFNFQAIEQTAAANDLNRWLASGAVKPLIGARFPFSEAVSAFRLQEENTLGKIGTLSGKIVLTPG